MTKTTTPTKQGLPVSLTEEQREELRSLGALGWPPDDIAVYFGWDRATFRTLTDDPDSEVSLLLLRGRLEKRARLEFRLMDDAIAGDSVLSDNTSGGYQMTEHLLSTGRRRIGFVGSVQATSSIMDRYLGYCRALLMAGIEPRADWRLEDRDADGKLIQAPLPKEMPDAFVCNCDEVAFNLVELLHREGYEVPRDVAVTGYDDYRFSTICRPQLTSYRIDVDGMAAAVVSQLRRKLNGKAPLAPTTIVPGAFVRRDST